MSTNRERYTEASLLAGYLRKRISVERFGGLIDDVSELLEGALQYNRREYETASELSDRVSKFKLATTVTDKVKERGVYETWDSYQDSLRKVKNSEDVSKKEREKLCVFLDELWKHCSERYVRELQAWSKVGTVSCAA